MLELVDDIYRCSECGKQGADLRTLSACPKCGAALHTKQTNDKRSVLAANRQFLQRLQAAIAASDDAVWRFAVKVVRGQVTSIKVQSDEDWKLDMPE